MIPEMGQRLGPYQVLGWLAGGGGNKVLRAWDGRLQREVAVKLIHERAATPEMRGALLREARLLSSLTHPNICSVFDIGEQDGVVYLVMELLEGETLREWMAVGALPLENSVRYAREVAGALALAHSRGTVHRDINPANIFVVDHANGRKQAKVLDFRLSWNGRKGSGEELGQTQVGAGVGMVSYMSPEEARGEKLDARTDLFALGVVLYEMVTGQLPFRGNTRALFFVELLREEPPRPVRQWNAAIPKALERVIQRLLEKEPEDRFQSALEVGMALERIGVEQRPSPLNKKERTDELLPREPQSRPRYPPRHAAAAQVKAVWEDPEESGAVRPGVQLGGREGGSVRVGGGPEERPRRLEIAVGEGDAGRRPIAAAVSGPVAISADAAVGDEREAVGGEEAYSNAPWGVPWEEEVESEKLAWAAEPGGAARHRLRWWVIAVVLAAVVVTGVAVVLGGWFRRAA
jgi:hypothetical protein